jgi:hypothetical protein
MRRQEEIDNARSRVLDGLQALERYVRRPSSVKANPDLFQKLSTELRTAEEAYRRLIDELVSERPSQAA